MRAQPILLRLGGDEWRVRPLTLRQIQEIEPLLRAADDNAGHSIATAIKIIAVALARDHADASAKLGDCEATAADIGLAMGAVLRLGGFIAEESPPGEGQAGADSISTLSTPA
jgi:hypothetical protein